MTRRRAIGLALGGLAVVLLGGFVAGGGYLASVAPSGTGYEAQTMCSAVFIAGRPEESVRAAEYQGLHPLLKAVSLTIDRPRREVRANLFGLGAQKSVYRPGMGCTLVDPGANLPAAPATLATSRLPPDDVISRGVQDIPPQVNRGRLASAIDLAFAETDAVEPQRTRALVVLLDGRPIAERYAPGFGKDMPLAGYSMTKAIMSALTGVLIQRAKFRLDQANLIPQWRGADDPRARITVDHLLHMTSGLRWSENSRDPRGDALIMAYHDRDVSALAASRPLDYPPGAAMSYSSGASNILSRVMRDSFGADQAAYLALPRTAIFDRTGMSTAMIAPDASGVLFGSTQGFATARDWARFGELYRNDGRWNGEQVLPLGWVAYSIRPQAATGGADYGAMIHLNGPRPDGSGSRAHPLLPEDTLLMTGQFGQVTAVVPSRRLVIVRMGESHGADAGAKIDRVIAEIVGAVRPAV